MMLLQPRAAEGVYEVAEDAEFIAPGFRMVKVPKGFLTDGASIPSLVPRWLIGSPFEPSLMGAAVAHDWLYQRGGANWSREECDAFFYALLQLANAPVPIPSNPLWWPLWPLRWARKKARPRMMWFAVRCFGGLFWNNCRPGREN